jgi:hypothetical protein
MLSLVLCSRNDRYQGNALWRLSTALNYVAARATEMDRARDVEMIVVDWGSDRPLHRDVQLSPAASGMTSFLWISPDLSSTLQKDSPFAEVLALNAGIRRARGEYIGRIDQDTLVGGGFLSWFFDRYSAGATNVPRDAILLSNRRSIPYRFAAQCPSFRAVERFIERSIDLPLAWPQPEHHYYRSPIGLLVLHRDLWHLCHGYDESMIYFNYMEWDLVLRLQERFQFFNLGRLVDHDFFHLDHEHPLSRWGVSGRRRKMNPARDEIDNPPPTFAPSSVDWGMHSNAALTLVRAEPAREWAKAGGSGRGASSAGDLLVRALTWGGMRADEGALLFFRIVMALPRFVLRRLPAGAQARALAARAAVEKHPLYRWPGILLTLGHTDATTPAE